MMDVVLWVLVFFAGYCALIQLTARARDWVAVSVITLPLWFPFAALAVIMVREVLSPL
jgi:hypothetical protein